MIAIPTGVRVWLATGHTIWHDGQGACLFTKRLERGRFIWPSVAGESVTISPAQLSYLLSGIDWRNPQETQRPTRVG